MKRLYGVYYVITIFLLCLITLCSVCPATLQAIPVLGPLLLGTVFSSVYDTATPLGTDAPSSLDDQIRLSKAANQERNNVDHYWPLSGTQVSDADAGEHRKVLFHAPIAATPTVAASHGDLRITDVSGKAEPAWTDEDEQELIVTDAGTLNIIEADLLGTVTNNTYFTAIDNAGTGTVSLIKADANDVAVVPDNSQTATNAAPTSSTGIANKKYVDDNIGSANWTPTSYAAEESVTFPNGLILKLGTVSATGDSTVSVTFGAAFPTAIKSVLLSRQGTNTISSGLLQHSSDATTGFSVTNGSSETQTVDWQAWGY